jgi:uncharacterized protein YggT (Ycf19 family)
MGATEPDSLTRDEERRVSQHEAVKERVRDEVHQNIERTTRRVQAGEAAQVESLSRELKEHAIREVSSTESELATSKRVARFSQVLDYAFLVLYGIVGLQIVLEAIAAREGSGFKQLMNTISGPFLAPFRGLLPDPSLGSSRLMLSYLIGLLVYVLLHVALRGLLRLLVVKRTTI